MWESFVILLKVLCIMSFCFLFRFVCFCFWGDFAYLTFYQNLWRWGSEMMKMHKSNLENLGYEFHIYQKTWNRKLVNPTNFSSPQHGFLCTALNDLMRRPNINCPCGFGSQCWRACVFLKFLAGFIVCGPLVESSLNCPGPLLEPPWLEPGLTYQSSPIMKWNWMLRGSGDSCN